ncbi:putative bifunctional diguanylate cyclase/phosphodiesterase [Falsiroseomonas sp. HW251]|uniref:putative bifunctional diguanylate cyclase/phosphodiesterase n=1 Tax=Falsiroseomonas sp. HW251 TaxID=3390998 RepID=UPI003D321C77
MAGPPPNAAPWRPVPALVGSLAGLLAGAALILLAIPLAGPAGTATVALLLAFGVVGALRAARVAGGDTTRDPLTGLASHAGLRERLEAMLAMARRHRWQLAVLVIDVRNFRAVNEAHGRGGGDQALGLLASRLRAAVRQEDVVARLAGDRFAVAQTVLQAPDAALRLAERLAGVLAAGLTLEGGTLSAQVDIGIALGPANGEEPGLLLDRAEEALEAARALPEPAIRCWAPALEAALRERRAIERDLRQAVAAEQFQLHWQPQRRLSDGRLVGFEALLRWPHPTRGMIPPAEFIPLAEATGLIVPLGAWVLRAAVAEAATWPGGLTVAVNLSVAQLKVEGLLATVAEALSISGLPPHRLELEVTESMLIQEDQACARTLAGLHALGVSISLDDFGTGWSSLAYLRRFPFDQIKMDRGFLGDLEADPRGDAVVSAILGLGRGLGISVLAEGIETEAQAKRLTALGCERGQGWLLGRPMPVDQARALIETEEKKAKRVAA